MGIKIKGPGRGDLTGTSNKERQSRANSFTAKQNARVSTSLAQQKNGFKGESLNDHGLPDGHVQVEADQPKPTAYTGAKYRNAGNSSKDEYADGVKGIKIKPKNSMDTDATKVGRGMTPPEAKENYRNKINKYSDKDLDTEMRSRLNYDGAKQSTLAREALDETVNRKWKKQGGYKMGTKGIKIKSKTA